MLRMKTAKLYAKVEFVRENNKIVGYIISAVKVVVSGMAIFGGGVMIATGTPIGVLFRRNPNYRWDQSNIERSDKSIENFRFKIRRYNCRSGDGNSNLHGIQTRV